MEKLTTTEDNYLKTIFSLRKSGDETVSNSAIAIQMGTSAASVTDMIKRLSEKGLLTYVKYRGVLLTYNGLLYAKSLIRKHRLWEVFLVEKLKFAWDEVHEIAEELEHVNSEKLVRKLDKYLGFPKIDPHGNPIPDEKFNYIPTIQKNLNSIKVGQKCAIVGVGIDSSEFLKHLNELNLRIGANVSCIEKSNFDNHMKLKVNKQSEVLISEKVAEQIFIQIKEK
ncbi:MAG: metal-dependent transcriptional regulator [Saprospiraceae bacterium]|nr:metal-dependent transcriptional regulator [Saprospiraceae bacterium]